LGSRPGGPTASRHGCGPLCGARLTDTS
jgi:hypothetical protein